MVTYIYFVKCPDCEDEYFDFFDEAKEFALGCLSKKPIITQTEVCRNDFGECTDHSDLGTIWSWEDECRDTEGDCTEAESASSIFTKDDLKRMADGSDPEFDSIDNSVDFEVEEPVTSEISAIDDVPDNFRKPIPEGMTIEELVEEMEENEDTVECTWCEDLFDKSECRYEVNLGWLCSRCEAAIKSRGETLTFKENNYWDFLDEDIDLEETYNFPKLLAIPDAKAQIIEIVAQDPDAGRFIKDGAIAVPARIDITNSFGTDYVTDFSVVDGIINVTMQRDNGFSKVLELDTIMNGGWFPKSIKRDCPAYKLLNAVKKAAQELNRSVKAATARDAKTYRTLTKETAEEFQQHITKIRYEIPLAEYSIGDFPSDADGFDAYAEKAVENLQTIRDKFLEWEFADQAIGAGIVHDRSIYTSDGELNDKIYFYATQWRAVGKITLDCPVSALSEEAQKVIKASKVFGDFENIKDNKEIDCIRLANALIKFFGDVKFYEKTLSETYPTKTAEPESLHDLGNTYDGDYPAEDADVLNEASLSDIAAAANNEYGTGYSERDLLDDAGVEDMDFFDDLETPTQVSAQGYRNKRRRQAYAIARDKAKKDGSMIEELEDKESYNSRLVVCPECGFETLDLETGICINCGFNHFD